MVLYCIALYCIVVLYGIVLYGIVSTGKPHIGVQGGAADSGVDLSLCRHTNSPKKENGMPQLHLRSFYLHTYMDGSWCAKEGLNLHLKTTAMTGDDNR